MNRYFDDNHLMIRDMVRDFARNEIAPIEVKRSNRCKARTQQQPSETAVVQLNRAAPPRRSSICTPGSRR